MTQPRVAMLEEIFPGGRSEYGGKAVQLAELRRRGFPVPEPVVIGAGADRRGAGAPRVRAAVRAARARATYPQVVQEPFWHLVRLRIRQEPLAGDLRDEILGALARLFPGKRPLLAVRSSAPEEDAADRSFAGIYRSVLGVASDDELWDAIRACWSALWSPRAVDYRRRAGVRGERS